MSSEAFDPTQHPRHGDGKFARKPHAETDVRLDSVTSPVAPHHNDWTAPEWADGTVPPDGDVERRDLSGVLDDEESVNSIVEGVLSSALQRARADHAANSTMSSWMYWAQAEARAHEPGSAQEQRFAQFAAGMEHGIVAIMSNTLEVRDEYVVARLQREMGSPPLAGLALRARREMTSKRSSRQSRQEWADTVRGMPDGPMRRGMLVSGAVLAGQDGWWGLRRSPQAVLG